MIGIRYQERQREQGVVSLLTVIFFMIFTSLIVLGFVTIVVADQRQTIDNDLSSSALAAARSGVEDGKRILLYCQANPTVAGCAEAINSQGNCNAFNSGTPAYNLATSLAVPLAANGEGTTGGAGASAYQQHFTCLTIQTKTPSLTTPLNADSDYIQHLKTVSRFTRLKVTWSGTGSYLQRSSGLAGWPTLSSWSSSRYMPVIQFQTIPYSSLANLDAVEAATKTVYLAPCDSACFVPSTDINLVDIRSGAGDLRAAGAPITYAQCTTLGNSYTCSITLSGYDSNISQYYIRASLLYATSTTLTLSTYMDATPVDFDNVQPWIDVTGRTNDVFRRVRTEVGYRPTSPLPRNALDSAAPICKDMTVTNDPGSSTYNCN